MKLLFIKHIDIEGPGTMGAYLKKNGFEYETINIFNNEPLPDNPAQFKAIVILGGPMNVYDEEKHPYLKAEDELIKTALNKNVPMLGLCLGAQLIAKATGAKVKKNDKKEIGWFKVNLTDFGKNDPLFQNLQPEIEVFQWHGDTFDVPENGNLLAGSALCKNQAFKYNNNVYGLQFHLEVTKEMVGNWLAAYAEEIAPMKEVNSRQILKYAESFSDAYNKQAEIFYENFLRICES